MCSFYFIFYLSSKLMAMKLKDAAQFLPPTHPHPHTPRSVLFLSILGGGGGGGRETETLKGTEVMRILVKKNHGL